LSLPSRGGGLALDEAPTPPALLLLLLLLLSSARPLSLGANWLIKALRRPQR